MPRCSSTAGASSTPETACCREAVRTRGSSRCAARPTSSRRRSNACSRRRSDSPRTEVKTIPARAPVARVRAKVLEAHGDRRDDPYYWLRDRDDPEVSAYLTAENGYADAVMDGARELHETLYAEIVGRIQETDTSAPTLFKGWWSYTRTVEGLDYEIHCRRRGSMEAPEQVVLDGNQLARGHDYFELGYVERSPDENLVAYAADYNGSELHELRFRDLRTGADLDDAISGVYYGAAWAADSKTFFYVLPDHSMRPYQVWRHRLGAPHG